MALMILASNREAVKTEILKWLCWNAHRYSRLQDDFSVPATERHPEAATVLTDLCEELRGIPVVDPEIAGSTGNDPTLSIRMPREMHASVKREAERLGMTPRSFARRAIQSALSERKLQQDV